MSDWSCQGTLGVPWNQANRNDPMQSRGRIEDSYGVQTLNVLDGDRSEYGAPVSVLRDHNTDFINVLEVFRRNNLKYVSIDDMPT